MNAIQTPPAYHEILCLRHKNGRLVISEDFVDITIKAYSDLVIYFDSISAAKISHQRLAHEYLKAGLAEPQFELVCMDKIGAILWVKDLEPIGVIE